MSNADFPINDLTVTQKLDLMERLWIDLSKKPSDVPSPDWHGDILTKRLQAVENGNVEFVDWDVAKNRLQKRFE